MLIYTPMGILHKQRPSYKSLLVLKLKVPLNRKRKTFERKTLVELLSPLRRLCLLGCIVLSVFVFLN